ncbi:MAG: hypothetical protein ACRCSP_03010 [Rhodoglobus sp.]
MKYSLRYTAASGAAVLLMSLFASTTAAQAAPEAASDEVIVSQERVVSQKCVAQVRAIALRKRVSADSAITLCSRTVTTTESSAKQATVADAQAYATSENMGEEQTRSLVAAAAAGGITYRDWTHTYWGGTLVEKHQGRTLWDGSQAWIASYRGYAGQHICHSEGGIAIGWAVTPISCSNPGAGSSADAVYRFDASLIFSGSPVTLNIGLHYSTDASGETSTWQVGG